MKLKAPEGMPEYLREMIENDTLKDQPKEFVERLIAGFDRIARGEIPPHVKEMYAVTSEVGRKNFEIARAANLLCDRVGEYVVREWKERQKQAKLPDFNMRTESVWDEGIRRQALARQMFDPPISEPAMVAGRPVFRIPDSGKKYPNFLTWWREVGREKPTDPQGWSTLSGPGVMQGRVELIRSADWSALGENERVLIQEWTKTFDIGMLYD
jgi:hypothetical protein